MLKLIGVLIVSCCTVIYGSHLSQRYLRRIKIRGELLRFLYHIQNGIKNNFGTLHDLYRSFDSSILYESGFINHLIHHNNITDLDLDKAETDKILNTFSFFGKSKSRDSEILLIDRAVSEFEVLFKEANIKDKNNSILYKKLSVALALVIAIILL